MGKSRNPEKVPTSRTRSIRRLEQLRGLSQHEREGLGAVVDQYAFRANRYYLNLIDWNDPDDPIRRLVVPHRRELDGLGSLDPCREGDITVQDGVQHKYSRTVLLLVTEKCVSFCRYCFRKRLFMDGNREAAIDLEAGLDYIRKHTEVDNILVTGGDPLALKTKQLEHILAELRRIKHVRVIRIGTKTPAFDPLRILNDPDLLRVFRRYSLPDRRIYLMCHFDHPRELTPQAREAMRRIIDSGVICLNQNPVVRGISDDPHTMARLWNELAYMGISQYYVFQCRPTAGNTSYAVPIVEAYHKIEHAKRHCSGLAKRIRYVMSHESGKVEVIGIDRRHIYMKYHRARFDRDRQRLLVCHRDDRAFWLDHLRPVSGFENEYFVGWRAQQHWA